MALFSAHEAASAQRSAEPTSQTGSRFRCAGQGTAAEPGNGTTRDKQAVDGDEHIGPGWRIASTRGLQRTSMRDSTYRFAAHTPCGGRVRGPRTRKAT